jgi:gamma-glutamylcyclotransferase
MLKYFAYGSNLHPVRLLRRVPDSQFLCLARVSGYRLCFHKRAKDGSAKADAFYTGQQEHVIHGALYRMPESSREILDRFEGVGFGYQVRQLEVTAGDSRHEAFIYIAQETYIEPELPPYEWYKDLVLLGAAHHGMPEGYVNTIARVNSIPDPSADRHQEHVEILQEMKRFSGQG